MSLTKRQRRSRPRALEPAGCRWGKAGNLIFESRDFTPLRTPAIRIICEAVC